MILWANDASTTIAGSLAPTSTTINLAAGSGALFPSPSGGDFFAVTLRDQLTQLDNEICYCTSRTGDSLIVTRAQEGTQPRNWNAGDVIANLVTAGTLAQLGQSGPQTDPRSLIYIGTDSGPPNGLIVPTTIPALPASGLQEGMTFNIKVAQSNTSPTVTAALGGFPAVPVKRSGGKDTIAGDMLGGHEYQFIFDGASLISQASGVTERSSAPQQVFHVAPTGNDLTGTGFDLATAFATPQGAYNSIIEQFVAVHTVTIQVHPGTYIGGIRFSGIGDGVDSWKMIGDEANPGSTIIDARSAVVYDQKQRKFVDAPPEMVAAYEAKVADYEERVRYWDENTAAGYDAGPYPVPLEFLPDGFAAVGSNYGDCCDMGQGTEAEISGFTLRSLNYCVSTAADSHCFFHDCTLYTPTSAAGSCIGCSNQSMLAVYGTLNVVSSGTPCAALVLSGNHGVVQWGRSTSQPYSKHLTVTISGSPTFTFTSWAQNLSEILVQASNSSFSGTCTGKRYNVAVCSVITGSGSTTYWPGTTTGTKDATSHYD